MINKCKNCKHAIEYSLEKWNHSWRQPHFMDVCQVKVSAEIDEYHNEVRIEICYCHEPEPVKKDMKE